MARLNLDKAKKALKEVEEAVAVALEIEASVDVAERVLEELRAEAKALNVENKRLEASIQQARDRYQAAKDEARKTREEADRDIVAAERRAADVRREVEQGVKDSEAALARTRALHDAETARLSGELQALQNLIDDAQRQRARMREQLA